MMRRPRLLLAGTVKTPLWWAPRRSYEGRQKSNLPRSEASLVMRTTKSQLLRAAAAEGEKVMASLGRDIEIRTSL